MTFPDLLRRYLPILDWGAQYSRETLAGDCVAAAIMATILFPAALANALLIGLPPQMGLYACIAPLVLYALFGTSRALAVGPVAVSSLMTAAAIAEVAAPGTPEFIGAATALAMMAGLLAIAMGALRLGFLADFLSRPVISGFITAAAVQIAAGQVGPLLGVSSKGETLLDVLASLVSSLGNVSVATAVLGVGALVFLLWARAGIKKLLLGIGLREALADKLAKTAPALVIVATTVAAWGLELEAHKVGVLGRVPKGLPSIALPPFDLSLWTKLLGPALLICIVGYVQSVSVALTLAAKRRQRVEPDQELIALGVADVGSAMSGGFPVTGALSGSVVNLAAGAQTPAAGAFTALGVALATLFLTPLLYFVPRAALAAIIIGAVLSLVDVKAIKRTYAYSGTDFAAMIGTILLTWATGLVAGLAVGLGLSVFLHLYRTSRPHVAVVGQIPGTMNFRNVSRHTVVTSPEILSLRVDASLYFPNARFIEDLVNDAVAANPAIRHLILECAAVNTIDASGLESLEAINQRLQDGGVTFHLSEVKGPVMDRLKRSHFLEELTGKVHLTQYDAVSSINPDLARHTRDAERAPGTVP